MLFVEKSCFFSDLILIRIFWLIKLFCISVNFTVEVNRNQYEKVDVAVKYTEFYVLLLEYCLGENDCVLMI